MVKLPTIATECPHCGHSTDTVLFGVESAIWFVCVCGQVVPFVVVKESKE